FKRFHQQLIGLSARFFRNAKIGGVKKNGIDLIQLGECQNFKDARGLCRELFDLPALHQDVLSFVNLIAFNDFLALHEALASWTIKGLAQASVTDGVQLMKVGAFASRRRKKLDGNRDEAKNNGALPYGCRHVLPKNRFALPTLARSGSGRP